MQIWNLKPGTRILVVRDFVDFDGQPFRAGTELVLRERHFLPYHDGHTLVFADGVAMRLTGLDPDNAPIIDDHQDVYWKVI